MVLEGEALVEFGERNRDADLGHVERVLVLQDEGAPSVLNAGKNGRADTFLLKHDISLDGRRRLILAGLDDPVLGGGARAQHLEDDDRIVNDRGGPIKGRANDHPVGITNVIVRDLDLEIAAENWQGLPLRRSDERDARFRLDARVT